MNHILSQGGSHVLVLPLDLSVSDGCQPNVRTASAEKSPAAMYGLPVECSPTCTNRYARLQPSHTKTRRPALPPSLSCRVAW